MFLWKDKEADAFSNIWEQNLTIQDIIDSIEKSQVDFGTKIIRVLQLKNGVKSTQAQIKKSIHGLLSATQFRSLSETVMEELLDKWYGDEVLEFERKFKD